MRYSLISLGSNRQWFDNLLSRQIHLSPSLKVTMESNFNITRVCILILLLTQDTLPLLIPKSWCTAFFLRLLCITSSTICQLAVLASISAVWWFLAAATFGASTFCTSTPFPNLCWPRIRLGSGNISCCSVMNQCSHNGIMCGSCQRTQTMVESWCHINIHIVRAQWLWPIVNHSGQLWHWWILSLHIQVECYWLDRTWIWKLPTWMFNWRSSRVEGVGAAIERDGFRAAFKSGLCVADDIERVCLTLTCTSHAE